MPPQPMPLKDPTTQKKWRYPKTQSQAILLRQLLKGNSKLEVLKVPSTPEGLKVPSILEGQNSFLSE